MLQRRDGPLVPGIEECRGSLPERREHPCDRSLNGRDAPEGERGGNESHDLAVRRIGIAGREDERVRGEPARAPPPPPGPAQTTWGRAKRGGSESSRRERHSRLRVSRRSPRRARFGGPAARLTPPDRKSTRLNSSHLGIS